MKSITSNDFLSYGMVLHLDNKQILDYLAFSTPMPESNNLYVAHDEKFYALDEVKAIEKAYFGGGKMEAGYCNGYNSLLNCLEYHGCIEINIALEDCALILGNLNSIHEGMIDSSNLEIFEVKKGESVLLYPGTLHFSPCKLASTGFKMAIFLTKGTNLDLKTPSSDPCLWKENKWLYAHKDAPQAKSGAHIGILGTNIEIKY